MTKRYLSMSALAIAATLTLAGCGSGDTPGTATAPESSAGAAAPETTQDTAAEPNDADVMFAQMMIPHHRQAVEMSEIMLSKDSISPEVRDLATEIRDAQAPEIETMTGWLEAWGEPVEPEGGMEGHDMGDMGGSGEMQGMMTEDELAELEAAEGDEAARMFLESMTAHHNGAVEMAQEEIENGQYPDAIALAETIVETQQAEIEEMEALLAEL
ncbi:Uncharacterized conserved protein, DUF305 family [Arthrobacter subterraneus]|uniref:Uncharacterized conserved protein, DUF305 family n=1 Tax=Arthrobacter subterraneus TaxID=335973 RepID=A0A1G8P0X5_9MICC|nr:DUF305 domain-containing protein [Arthrobacter subterraneus]SDI86117.1 Uncharacterized conserved protein, DUF305 family [Arthrobacter subterraneus]